MSSIEGMVSMDSAPFPHPGQMLESLFMMNVGGETKRGLEPKPRWKMPAACTPTHLQVFNMARSPSPVGTGMHTGPCTDLPALLPSADVCFMASVRYSRAPLPMWVSCHGNCLHGHSLQHRPPATVCPRNLYAGALLSPQSVTVMFV